MSFMAINFHVLILVGVLGAFIEISRVKEKIVNCYISELQMYLAWFFRVSVIHRTLTSTTGS